MTSLQKTLLGIALTIISLIMVLCGLYPFNLFLSLAGGVLIGLFHKEGYSELKQLWSFNYSNPYRSFSFLFIHGNTSKGSFWIRFFGYGFKLKDKRVAHLLFSERNGYRGYHLGNYYLKFFGSKGF